MSDFEKPDASYGVRRIPWYYRTLMVLAAVFLFSMASLTFVDVIGRYVFNAPVPGTFEIVEYLLGLLTFSSLPLITRARGHVTVDIFDRFIRGGFRWLTDIGAYLGSIAVVGLIGHRMWVTAWDELAADYVSEYLGITRAPFLLVFSFLSAVTVAILVYMLWRYVANGFVHDQHDPTGTHGTGV